MKVRTPPDALVNLRPDHWTQPFWEAAGQGRLVAPRCTACDSFRLPPAAFCHVCRQQAVDWVELSGRGDLYSYTVVHHPVVPDLAEYVPYAVGVVGLPETDGCRLIGNLVDVDTDDIAVGMALEVAWHEAGDWTVPRWRPA